jgi:hypothetical protein
VVDVRPRDQRVQQPPLVLARQDDPVLRQPDAQHPLELLAVDRPRVVRVRQPEQERQLALERRVQHRLRHRLKVGHRREAGLPRVERRDQPPRQVPAVQPQQLLHLLLREPPR